MGKIISLQQEPLTIEKLRTFEGFENYTDEEATETLFSLNQFAALLYEYYLEVKAEENETNQQDQLKLAA